VTFLAALLVATTSLQITVWPNGQGEAPKRTYTLKCAPVSGTLPGRAAACRKLTPMIRPFRPTPRNRACTDIYGGPQVALVTGRFRGRSVRAEFGRKNGCEIARWNRVAFLFPVSISAQRR
jgi:hypothetical protein